MVGGAYLRAGTGTATNYACDGFGAGSQWLAFKMGAFKNFRRMTVDLLPYDGGAFGVTFNYVKKAFTPSATVFNPTFSYNLVFRNAPGQEQCWGAYRLDSNVPTLLARSGNSSAFVPAVGRMHTLTVVKSGRNMTFLLSSIQAGLPDVSISGSFVDPAPADLPAGSVGLLANGISTIAYDNFFIQDDPLCTDGLMNGDEEGPDCGGSCPSACLYPVTLTHDWTNSGLTGWEVLNYANTADQARYWVETDGKLWQRVNHGTDYVPGGQQCMVMWQGHMLMATLWGRVYDFDLDVVQQNTDNDGAGIVFRYVDADNFYLMMTNNEDCCVTIRRRRAGIDTMLPITGLPDGTKYGFYADPVAKTGFSANGVVHSYFYTVVKDAATPTNGTYGGNCGGLPQGSAYNSGGAAVTWKFRVRGNLFQWWSRGVLMVEAYDAEDGSAMSPGMVRFAPPLPAPS